MRLFLIRRTGRARAGLVGSSHDTASREQRDAGGLRPAVAINESPADASRRARDPLRPRLAVTPQAKTERDHQRTEYYRVGADPQGHGQRSGNRSHDQQAAEDHRRDPAQDQPPLVVDVLAQPDGGDDLQDAGNDGPACDKPYEREQRQSRPGERDHTGGDADDAFEDQVPPRLPRPAGDGRDQVEDAVDDGIGAEEHDQHGEGHSGIYERQDAEDHSGDATKDERPPVPSQCFHDILLPSPGFASRGLELSGRRSALAAGRSGAHLPTGGPRRTAWSERG